MSEESRKRIYLGALERAHASGESPEELDQLLLDSAHVHEETARYCWWKLYERLYDPTTGKLDRSTDPHVRDWVEENEVELHRLRSRYRVDS